MLSIQKRQMLQYSCHVAAAYVDNRGLIFLFRVNMVSNRLQILPDNLSRMHINYVLL